MAAKTGYPHIKNRALEKVRSGVKYRAVINGGFLIAKS